MAIEVQTTHNVTIDYEEASVLKRILAYVIDIVLILAFVFAFLYTIGEGISYMTLDTNEDPVGLLITYLFIGIIVFYDLIFECCFVGQTPGKMAMGIRVIRLDGSIPSISEYTLRWVFRPIDITITHGLLAILMVACSKKSQRLGDYIAGTTVIDIRPSKKDKELLFDEHYERKEYQVLFPNIMHDFNDRDIETVKTVLQSYDFSTNHTMFERLIERIELKEGYQYDSKKETERRFLERFIADYEYLATR